MVYDVIIIGAGPAGSYAANRLVNFGANVLIVEQALSIGSKVQCAEYVPKIISQYVDLSPEDIAQPVERLHTYINDKLAKTIRAPGYILNRSLWDKKQVQKAVNAGAQIMTGTRAVGFEDGTVFLRCADSEFSVKGRIILGCDGPRSKVSTWLGNHPQHLCIGFQYEMTLTKLLDDTLVYFEPTFYGGYAWLFPKGEKANVGLGVDIAKKDQGIKILHDFCGKLVKQGIISSMNISSRTAGLIPFGGLRNKLTNGQMLLAGDAAGCTHPLTGAGIMSAVVSGKLAAEAIIGYLQTGHKAKVAAEYRQALAGELQAYLEKARLKAIERNFAWSNNPQVFERIVRRSWVTFPEYHSSSTDPSNLI